MPQDRSPKKKKSFGESTIRAERLDQLVDSCQQEVLRQIIGPFGLTPAMFDDKVGGNVATTHNADQSIFPNELHEENFKDANTAYSQDVRQHNWDDKKSRGETHKANNQAIDAGQDVLSAATQQPMTKGQIHGDHTVSLKEAHGNKELHLRFTEEERKAILNNEKNMAFIEASLNTAKGERSWKECLSDPNFVEKHNLSADDIKRIKGLDKKARNFIQREQDKRLDGELLQTGAAEAGKNALRQAMGVVLHEFANGSFTEIKVLLKERNSENLIDSLIDSLKRVMDRVIGKLKAALDAAIQGGVQGFISNLLTFLINNLITTSKKVVTIIRESMQSVWAAIKLIANPPEGMSALEVTRQVTKIIATVVTTALGMLMEESIKGFIMSVPVFVPVADVLATALTAIMTGISCALIVYGIDRLFDWLNSSGTELFAAQEANAEAQTAAVGYMHTWLSLQYQCSRNYETCAAEYEQLKKTFSTISFEMETATIDAGASIQSHTAMIDTVETQLERTRRLANALNSL